MCKIYLFFSVFLFIAVSGAVADPGSSIPFRLIDKLIVIQATVDGRPGNFILDTGVPNLVLNARYFDGAPTDNTFYGLNGSAGRVCYNYAQLEIGPHYWKKAYADVIELHHLEEVGGLPVHGLLGSRLFQQHALLIDLKIGALELYPLDKQGMHPEFEDLHTEAEILPFQLKGSTPLVRAQIRDIPLRLVIDTGAAGNLMHESYRQELQDHLTGRHKSLLRGLGSDDRWVSSGKLAKMVVGGQPCEPMRTMFTSIDHWNYYVPGPAADGILGYEFLSQFRVAINFRKREMYIWATEKGGLKTEALIVNKREEGIAVGRGE